MCGQECKRQFSAHSHFPVRAPFRPSLQVFGVRDFASSEYACVHGVSVNKGSWRSGDTPPAAPPEVLYPVALTVYFLAPVQMSRIMVFLSAILCAFRPFVRQRCQAMRSTPYLTHDSVWFMA